MKTVEILQIGEIAISLILALVILLQQGGGGLGTMFGGSGGESYRSKRGVGTMLYRLTIVLVVLFVINALVIALLSS